MYRNDALWVWLNIRLKILVLPKSFFYIKRTMDVSGKGLLQVSPLMGHQTNHKINVFLSYKSNSRYESDCECKPMLEIIIALTVAL